MGTSRRNYVVLTMPGQDDLAAANLQDQGFEVFNPTVVIERKHPRFQRLSTSRTEPLFPGYIFITFDVDRDHWRSINGTRGVRGILGSSERPTAIPLGVLEDILARHAAGEFTERVRTTAVLRAGQRGRVEAGPFQGHTGECVMTRATRVQLLLHLLGGAVKAWFPIEAVVSAA